MLFRSRHNTVTPKLNSAGVGLFIPCLHKQAPVTCAERKIGAPLSGQARVGNATAESDIQNEWLVGSWQGSGGRTWTVVLDLEVKSGNQVRGSIVTTNPEGRSGHGSVSGKVDGIQVELDIIFDQSGVNYQYSLLRSGDALIGMSSTGWGIRLKRKDE